MGARLEEDANQNKHDNEKTAKSSEQFSRKNGWTWPLHPLQVLAWASLLYLALFFYCTTIQALVPALKYACYAVSLHVITCIYQENTINNYHYPC